MCVCVCERNYCVKQNVHLKYFLQSMCGEKKIIKVLWKVSTSHFLNRKQEYSALGHHFV